VLRKKGKGKGKRGSFEFNLKPVVAPAATASLQPPTLPDLNIHLHRDSTIGILLKNQNKKAKQKQKNKKKKKWFALITPYKYFPLVSQAGIPSWHLWD
jgi:hypothetical protein